MKRNGKHYLMLALGWIFIILGIIGLFLPVLQGVLFLAIGLVLLSRRSPRLRLMIVKLGRRYPRFRSTLEAARARVRSLRARLSRRGGMSSDVR